MDVCILCGNRVDLFTCIFYFCDGKFYFNFQILIDGMCRMVLMHTTKTMSGATFHHLKYCDVIDEWLIFCNFPIKNLCKESIITQSKF